MGDPFDGDLIARLGWCQGSVLAPGLATAARDHAPPHIALAETDWLIVTSHDCDIVNFSLDKEPVVEVLRGSPIKGKADATQHWGRNPRSWHVLVSANPSPVTLSFRVHDRWTIPRALLMEEPPAQQLPAKERRAMAEWLAKRYIRAAFPTAFDQRWRAKMKEWVQLLQADSQLVQGIYLRLNTLDELEPAAPYLCHLLVAVPASKRKGSDWIATRDGLERRIEAFWQQFAPGIRCAGVEVLGMDEIALDDLAGYQRFDADWVSFADDTDPMPIASDMNS